MPIYRIEFTYTTTGIIEVHADGETEAKVLAEDTLSAAKLGLISEDAASDDIILSVYDPDIEFDRIEEE